MNISREEEFYKMKKVVVIPGDGIGPEILEATLTVLNELVSDIEFVVYGIAKR